MSGIFGRPQRGTSQTPTESKDALRGSFTNTGGQSKNPHIISHFSMFRCFQNMCINSVVLCAGEILSKKPQRANGS